MEFGFNLLFFFLFFHRFLWIIRGFQNWTDYLRPEEGAFLLRKFKSLLIRLTSGAGLFISWFPCLIILPTKVSSISITTTFFFFSCFSSFQSLLSTNHLVQQSFLSSSIHLSANISNSQKPAKQNPLTLTRARFLSVSFFGLLPFFHPLSRSSFLPSHRASSSLNAPTTT